MYQKSCIGKLRNKKKTDTFYITQTVCFPVFYIHWGRSRLKHCKVLQINDKSSNSANVSWDNTVQTANRWEYHTVCDLPPVIWYGGSESTSVWKGSKFHGYSQPKTAALPVKRNSQTRINCALLHWGMEPCLHSLTLLHIAKSFTVKCSWPKGTTVWKAPISQCLLHSISTKVPFHITDLHFQKFSTN